MGIQQQGRQQQTMQTDRLVVDGLTRGMDDPDNRRQQARPQDLSPPRDDALPWRERWRFNAEQRVEGARYRVTILCEQESHDHLAAQVEALHHRLQAERQAREQARPRGQGRGY